MRSSRAPFRPLVVGTLIGAIGAVLFLSGIFSHLSSAAADRLFLPHAANPAITIVAIDDSSISQIGRWPWPRTVHADLIKALSDAGARVIAYDVNFPEVSNAADDAKLALAIRQAGNVVLPIELQLVNAGGQLQYDKQHVLAPIQPIASSASSTGFSNTPLDADGVMRSVPLFLPSNFTDSSPIPSFAAEALRLTGHAQDVLAAPLEQGRVNVNFPDQPFKGFRIISAVDVLRGRADLSQIKNGIVFVGSTASDLHDALLVPTSNGIPMSGVEIHASIFDTIAGHHWLLHVPPWTLALGLLALGCLIGLLVSQLRARYSAPLIFLGWIAMVASAFVLFDRGLIVDIVWPTIVLVIAYAAVTLERRVTSDLERRELRHALSRYVSKNVVESILNDPEKLKLGGERKRMTVLFSDIRGFTTISEGMGPDALVQMLNVYLDRMTNIVFEHDGVLDKYIGDAVMAFWNAPFDQVDHASRAVETALHMKNALVEMNRAHAFGKTEIKIGIGINTGEMVVGNVGGEARFDYTVIGDNVNLGSRLEGLTKEYGVWILTTEATRGDLQDQFLLRRVDKVAVKGKHEPVVIYEVMERLSSATPEQRKLAETFETALDAYFKKDFAFASAQCEAILKTYPDDGPSKTLLARAKQFIQTPPSSDWDGTWVYTKK